MGPPRERLTQLAASLDILFGRLAATLRHERRQSAEIAHELRSPLARLRAEAEIALRRERTAEELQGVLGKGRPGRDRSGRDRRHPAVVSQKDLEPGVRVACAAATALRLLAPGLGNATGYAKSVAHLSVLERGAEVVSFVTDDGPGVSVQEAEAIFSPRRPGQRGRGECRIRSRTDPGPSARAGGRDITARVGNCELVEVRLRAGPSADTALTSGPRHG